LSHTLDQKVIKSRHVPLGARALIEVPSPDELKPQSFLHIPDNAKDACPWGWVKALGPFFQADLPDGASAEATIAIGDVVLFGRYTGNEVELPNKRRLVYLAEEDIIGKLIEDES
jgi:chaperonin GroES